MGGRGVEEEGWRAGGSGVGNAAAAAALAAAPFRPRLCGKA